jgi:thiazole synthase ThiGH ThiG subunit
VAQRQAFQYALIQLGLDAFLWQPAVADLRDTASMAASMVEKVHDSPAARAAGWLSAI